MKQHDRVLMGPAKKSKNILKEKKLVLIMKQDTLLLVLKLDGANDVQKITIIPRGMAGGYTNASKRRKIYVYQKRITRNN